MTSENSDPGLELAVCRRAEQAAGEARPGVDVVGEGRAAMAIPGGYVVRGAEKIGSEGKDTGPGVSDRERLAELILAGNPLSSVGEVESTVDAVLAAGWRPPQPDSDSAGCPCGHFGTCDHNLDQPAPLPAASVEHDAEADAWYVRILDDDVHHTTESAPVNLDWTRDGTLIGVELLGPLRRDRPGSVTEWAVRRAGLTIPYSSEDSARRAAALSPAVVGDVTLLRREAGPWTEVPS